MEQVGFRRHVGVEGWGRREDTRSGRRVAGLLLERGRSGP
jgi:hypothetical protein